MYTHPHAPAIICARATHTHIPWPTQAAACRQAKPLASQMRRRLLSGEGISTPGPGEAPTTLKTLTEYGNDGGRMARLLAELLPMACVTNLKQHANGGMRWSLCAFGFKLVRKCGYNTTILSTQTDNWTLYTPASSTEAGREQARDVLETSLNRLKFHTEEDSPSNGTSSSSDTTKFSIDAVSHLNSDPSIPLTARELRAFEAKFSTMLELMNAEVSPDHLDNGQAQDEVIQCAVCPIACVRANYPSSSPRVHPC